MRNLPARLVFTVALLGSAAGGLVLLFRAFSLGPGQGAADAGDAGDAREPAWLAPSDGGPDASPPDGAPEPPLGDAGDAVLDAQAASEGAAADAPPNPCAAYLDANEEAFAALVAKSKGCDGEGAPKHDPASACAMEPEGGGAVVLRTRTLTCRDGDFDGTWEIGRLEAPGDPWPKGAASGKVGGRHGDSTGPELKGTFDFDGDGALEAAVALRPYTDDDADVARVTVYTAPKPGPAHAYLRASRDDLVGLDDEDDDGRPDLRVLRDLVARRTSCAGADANEEPFFRLELTWHSVDAGTFRFDDVSFDEVRSACETLGAAVLAPDAAPPDPSDPEALAKAIVCARMGGASPGAVERWVKPVCPTIRPLDPRSRRGICPPDRPDAAPPPDYACDAWVRRLAQAAVPFTVPTSKGTKDAG